MYKVDLHTHCSENSKCAPHDGKTIAEAYKNAGFDGLVITNHFLGGMYTDLAKIDWQREVDFFFTGYEHAKEYGDAHGLDVFFGWEYRFFESDILTYGLGRDWLLAHPDMCTWTPDRYFDEVHAAGGFVTHAHPFREVPGAKDCTVRLFGKKVDAVEIYNGSHEASCFGDDRLKFNERAEWYAKAYKRIELAGSDTHGVYKNAEGKIMPFRYGAVIFNERFENEKEMIAAIRNGEYSLDCPELIFEEFKTRK